jgi:uncharacterized RDD family membrane protein YckC
LRPADAADGPPADLRLGPSAPPPSPAPRPAARDARGAGLQPADLPLFDAPVPGVDDTPLLTVPSAPRSPLSVRRAAPEPSRRPTTAAGDESRSVRQRPRDSALVHAGTPASAPRGQAAEGTDPQAAPAATRLAAAVLDLVIVGAIDAAVVYFTLQVTGLDAAQLSRLPVVPLAAFLLLLDLGYLVGFTTASGQTIGKMAAGVRVVSDRTARVPLGQAIIRAAAVALTVLSAGVGYLPALVGRDRRALHDRISGTRVLRR